MNVCIVGGGHIGTALVCYIKHIYPDYRVTLYTRKPELFAEEIKCNDIEQQISYYVKPDVISNNAELAAGDADIVFIALPHFAIEKAFEDIAPYVSTNAFIGVLPGGGGCEFIFKYNFREIRIDEKVLFLDRQLHKRQMYSTITAKVIEDALVHHIDSHIKTIDEIIDIVLNHFLKPIKNIEEHNKDSLVQNIKRM